MSMKVLKTVWEIEDKIRNMNKAEIVEYMKGYLKQAEINVNDNKNVVHHTCLEIKRKLQSIETELFILETIGVQDKRVGKAYLLDELERIKERIGVSSGKLPITTLRVLDTLFKALILLSL